MINLSRTSQRRIEKLVGQLKLIQSRPETIPDLLRAFHSDYDQLNREEKPWFFDTLLRHMETKSEDISSPLQQVVTARSDDPIQWSRCLTDLRRKLESPRLRAFRRFLNVSGGFKFLLDFRADLLYAQRQTALELDPLEEELSHLFDTWFQHGFLFLQEITRDSSFRQIRFLKEHDMVHPMASLEEMGNRLGEDRRCFALYHRAMPEEPVVFIEAALTKGMAPSIHEIIREGEPSTIETKPDTAILYSINNTQNGLAGLGLGKVLVFQVVDAIKKDYTGIKMFSTLSPITGFWPRYLEPILRGRDDPFQMKRSHLMKYFAERVRHEATEHHARRTTDEEPSDFLSLLRDVLSDPKWIDDPLYAKWLAKPLTEIAYFYIAKEHDRQGKPLNSVANFHLGNGARVHIKNINFGANLSERGMADSCGMMVNYIYSENWLQQIGTSMKSWLSWNV